MSPEPHPDRRDADHGSPEQEVNALRRELFDLLPAVTVVCGPDHPVFHLLARALTRPETSMQETLQRLRLAWFAFAELPEGTQQRLRAWAYQMLNTRTPCSAMPDPEAADPSGEIVVAVGEHRGADTAAAMLTAVDYTVRVVRDGPKMRQEVDRRRPALAIIDILLPGDDGNED